MRLAGALVRRRSAFPLWSGCPGSLDCRLSPDLGSHAIGDRTVLSKPGAAAVTLHRPAMAASSEQPTPSTFIHGASGAAHLFLALSVAGRLLWCKDGAAAGRGSDGGSRWYWVAVCTTWALAASELLLAAYTCYSDSGAGWVLDAMADQADAAARAVAWLLLAAYLHFELGRRRRGERFPTPLILWWALFLLLSVFSVAATTHVPAPSWVLDAVSVLAAAVLLLSGFLGKRDARGGSASSPLLNGASEAAAERDGVDASLYTGAGFFSFLTFSPLFALGHKKTS